MVIVILAGGLGNQLFQYAFGLRLAHDLNKELRLSTHLLENRLLARFRDFTPRSFELSVFELPAPAASVFDMVRCLVGSLLPPWGRTFVLRETALKPPTDALALKKAQDVLCMGYWQSEECFQSVAYLIRRQLTFRQGLSNSSRLMATQIAQCEQSVFVHIRRGDYISNAKAGEYHGFCGEAYYRQAITYLREQLTDAVFFVFSDDMDWVRQHLADALPLATLVEDNTGADSWQDMYLMSRCRHAIIANSSFSWWGAWLNPEINRFVVAPRHWFASGREPVLPIIPARWITL